jgi:hypothetical protein
LWYNKVPRIPNIDFFADSRFSVFKSSLDAEMKRLQALGLGSQSTRPSQ